MFSIESLSWFKICAVISDPGNYTYQHSETLSAVLRSSSNLSQVLTQTFSLGSNDKAENV